MRETNIIDRLEDFVDLVDQLVDAVKTRCTKTANGWRVVRDGKIDRRLYALADRVDRNSMDGDLDLLDRSRAWRERDFPLRMNVTAALGSIMGCCLEEPSIIENEELDTLIDVARRIRTLVQDPVFRVEAAGRDVHGRISKNQRN